MREGWQQARLADVCKVIAGQSPKGSAYNSCGDGLPFHQGKKYFRETFLGDSNIWTAQITKEAFPGDILMSVRAPVGPVNFTNQHMCIGRGLAAIRATEKVDRMFLFYWLLSIQSEIRGNEGAVFASINKKQIENIGLPLPPLPEQKRIVAILDEAFAGIATAVANTEKNLANARELYESYLNAVFSQRGDNWTEAELSSLIDISHGFAFKGKDFQASSDAARPIVLTPGNYTETAELDFSPKNTKRYFGEVPSRFLFKEGVLTIVMTDLSPKMKILGKPAFICQPNILHNQRIGRVILKDGRLDLRFLYYFLGTRYVSEEIKRTATGTMVKHTAPKRILALQAPLPQSLEAQQEIVYALDSLSTEVRRAENIFRQKLDALGELKQSILKKAFSGELTASKDASSAIGKTEDVA